jgi:small subunit ribosomal protein S8
MVKDGISDLIVALKNGNKAGKEVVTTPYSNLKAAVLEVLEKEGYISSFSKKGKKTIKNIEVALKYDGKTPAINETTRISKFSKRVYKNVAQIRPYKNGVGITVLTTPKGILTDREAKKQNVGGEVLFTIW